MWFSAGVPTYRAAGPLLWISLCGITSLSTIVIVPLRAIRVDCAAAQAPPLTDHVWQPRTWWRITSALDFGACEATAAAEPAATPHRATIAALMTSECFI